MQNPPFGFDPSKMDPQMLMQLSELVRALPPEKIFKMQSLMHNMMAGFDVSKEMAEFERDLPPGFREKMISLIGSQAGLSGSRENSRELPGEEMDMHQARITVLKAVASGSVSPEEAEKVLFPR